MAYLKLTRFSGIAPAVSPKLISDQFAQVAENIDFESGAVQPITDDAAVTGGGLSNSTRRSIYLYRPEAPNEYWLQWDDDNVSVVRGPLPDDAFYRLYWSGEDYPRMSTDVAITSSAPYPGTSYRLGVPAPANAPSTSKTGTPDAAQTPNDVSYVYTFVTAYGEEGPPSPPTTAFELTDTESVTVTMPSGDHPTGNYNFTGNALKRIYRSNTGSNTTEFQFAGEVPFATTTFTDTNTAASLGEILPSSTWIGPPDDNASDYPSGPLEQLTALANGILAGFTGNRLCFSEAFLPHAWPVSYRISLEEDIVAIAATNTGIVCLTKSTPYFVTGSDPSAMTAVQVPLAESCINRNSVVDMGEYVLYASPDGLAAVSSDGSGNVVSKGVISPKQWNADFKPTLIRAFMHEGTYVAFYNDGGTLGGWVFDPRSQESAFSTITVSSEVRGGWMDTHDGVLNMIVGNAIQAYRGGTTPKTSRWKSKNFVVSKPLSMGWVHVEAESYPITVKVWADGTLLANYTLSQSGSTYTQVTATPSGISNATLREPVMRLPSVLAKEWEVEVSGTGRIDEVCLAQSIDELAGS